MNKYRLCFVLFPAQIRQRCGTPPAAPIRIEKAINECLEDIKLSLDEALSELDASAALVSKDVKGRQPGKSRAKRQTFSEDERSIAGPNLTCPLSAHQLNADGVPTGEGLVKLYAEGSQDANFFLATAQAVNHCMGTAQQQGRLLPQALRGKRRTVNYRAQTVAP
ncbi:hypothetical protein ONE63_001816 [Megalurothrips usitatus]|uniref:Uncharacterized protein n=1 Tax=Megalurothrips usitatus TaxID=439358 RepID=A0AAV7XGE2_9NEOP|nr:hypothetical protein ONE63_001816 [Megalurothrips usitatus]